MNYMLDTNIVSDLIAGNDTALRRVENLNMDDRLSVCSIVLGEVLYGLMRMPQGRRREETIRYAEDTLAMMDYAPVPPEAGDYYASIRVNVERRGLALADNDIWIAATALAHDAVLVTRDTDFHRIESLATENWAV